MQHSLLLTILLCVNLIGDLSAQAFNLGIAIVDLNEESVEIAKLSLWLRTAQPKRKLNDLSRNIKCGNSLIDSKVVAGNKTFNWETQFSKVFVSDVYRYVVSTFMYLERQISRGEKKEARSGGHTYNGHIALTPS